MAARRQRSSRRRSVFVVPGVIAALGLGLLGFGLYGRLRQQGTASPGDGAIAIPAAAFQAHTWGYVGCSNTHDTIFGYQEVPGSLQLFWPFGTYHIEGQAVDHWAQPSSLVWSLFDQEKQEFNGGKDPPVIWIQACANLNPGEANSGPVSYDALVKMIQNVRAHAPTSILFVSPLQSYDPPTLCPEMGPNGEEISQVAGWLDQAIAQGLAHAGPGTDSIPNLGPLTSALAARDGCHPNGGPHGPGTGVDVLGKQLADFFDHLPRS
jgi:hypothetical protein